MPKKRVDPLESLFEYAKATLNIGADFASRTIWLYDFINAMEAYRLAVTLHFLDQSDGPINIIMSSAGGEEGAGYAIYDTIKMVGNPVIITGLGAVQSISAMILQAADLRILSPECTFMIHNGSIELDGRVEQDIFVSMGREIERNSIRYHRILAERSGLALSEVKKMCEKETYYTAHDAVKSGFADGVLETRPLYDGLVESFKNAKEVDDE